MQSNKDSLHLDHCHHCGIDAPDMALDSSFMTNNHRGDAPREWNIYHCESCGGAVLTGSIPGSGVISEIYPSAIKSSQFNQPMMQPGLSARAGQRNAVGHDAHGGHFLMMI